MIAARDLELAREAETHFARITRMQGMSYAERRALFTGRDAARWVESAARAGLPQAQIRLGRMLLDARDEVGAVAWFRRAADAGDAEAMNMVGRCYENGWGVAKDLAVAACWYESSADAGHDWGEYNLANLLFDGRGAGRDRTRAVAWYRRAADQGHARAMNLLGRCLEEGWGCPPNLVEAATWYRRSAEAGYFRAQINHAAVLAERGQCVEAADWRARAEAGRAEWAAGDQPLASRASA